MKLSSLRLLNLCIIGFHNNLLWMLTGAILFIALLVYLPAGIYLGGDWTLPATAYQTQQFFSPYVWSSAHNFGMPSFPAVLGLPYGFFVYFITALGLPVEYIGKTVLTFVIVLSYFTLYRLLRYFKLLETSAVIGGLIYITTPIFFNYALMGWQFALLAMALFPVAAQWFCQTVKQDDIRYAIGVALIWAIATLQSQSLVWLPVIFLSLGVFLIRDRRTAQEFIKKLGLIFILFVGLSSYWWIGLILFQDIEITSNALVISDISVGADSYFIALNALRLWGGLFNFQFETTVLQGLEFGSWILPMFATVAILVSKGKNRQIALAMGLIAFVMPAALLLLKEHREILLLIPGSALIRQLSRFTVLTSFAYAVLVGIFLDLLLSSRRFHIRLLFIPTVALLIAASWPWWSGALKYSSDSVAYGKDFRLRVKEFPYDYYEVEKYLGEIRWISRALYLPYGMITSYKDDPKYRGAYKEAVDVFAAHSPIPGIFMPSDRVSLISDYIAFLKRSDNLIAATQFSPTNFYVLRKNMDPSVTEPVFINEISYFPEAMFDRIWDSKNIRIYARKNPVPLIYSPSVRQLHYGNLDSLGEMALSEGAIHGMAIVLAAQNANKKDVMVRFTADSEMPREVEYRKINPTKYRIRLHNARGDTPLIFGEGYSTGWKIYPIDYDHTQENIAHNIKGFSVAPSNERYQADTDEAKALTTQRLISETGGQFISKRFLGAIQNDNLADGSLMETWYSYPLPEGRHLKVNGYVNGWLIDVAQLCSDSHACHRNADGSFEVELVMEFWPQQAFYLGLATTLLTFLFGGILMNRGNRNMKKLTSKCDARN